MELLFLKGTSPLSKLIMSTTGEPISHCAIRAGDAVVHSNLLGVHAQTMESLLTNHTIVDSVTIADDPQKLLNLLVKYQWSPYDTGALLYMGLQRVIPGLPKQNLWHVSGMFLCTEWLQEYENFPINPEQTPGQLLTQLKSQEK
jgi:hypothetical protein